MASLSLLQDMPVLFISITGIIGLMVGSFLNVVIYRLPVMMEQTWQKECREFLGLATPENHPKEEINLLMPRSRCPHCKTVIRAHQNIPVLSYLLLGGKCGQCNYPISIRYPLIEALTGILSAIIAWHFGFTAEAFFALILTWALIALSGIDFYHQLLPDSITIPCLWLGLFLSLLHYFSTPHSSIIGAIAGYLILWSVYQIFKLATGKEGMGFGDFKLLALFGAWLGWQALPVIILLSSLVGAFIGILLVIFAKHDHKIPIPFGPYIAIAGWIALLWGDAINQYYLKITGL